MLVTPDPIFVCKSISYDLLDEVYINLRRAVDIFKSHLIPSLSAYVLIVSSTSQGRLPTTLATLKTDLTQYWHLAVRRILERMHIRKLSCHTWPYTTETKYPRETLTLTSPDLIEKIIIA